MHGTSESDVEADKHLARTRETGGEPTDHPVDSTEGDAEGTTGTGEGDGQTGAEARADAGEVNP